MFYFGRKKEKNQNKNHMLYKCVMQWGIDLNYTIWKSYRVIGTWKRWPISTSKHFFMNQKEKPRRLIHYHAQILLSFRIDFEISMAYWFIKRELSQIENI